MSMALKLETAASTGTDLGIIGVALALLNQSETTVQTICITALAVAIVSWRGAVRIWGK